MYVGATLIAMHNFLFHGIAHVRILNEQRSNNIKTVTYVQYMYYTNLHKNCYKYIPANAAAIFLTGWLPMTAYLRLKVRSMFVHATGVLIHVVYQYKQINVLNISAKCPDLIPGPNQIVSSSEGYVGDSIQVSCGSGFVLDVGAFTKDITCVDNASIAVWDEGLGNCTREYAIDHISRDEGRGLRGI